MIEKRKSRRPNGSGTVYFLRGHRTRPWVAKVATYNASGGRQWHTIGYFRTKTEGEMALLANAFQPLTPKANITFKGLYDEWSASHFARVGKQAQRSYKVAYHYCVNLYNMRFSEIRTTHMQAIIDGNNCKSASTLNLIRVLLSLLYAYALENDIVQKNYASFLNLPKNETAESGIFSDMEIAAYFKDGSEAAQILLMLIYSGMRIQELLNLTAFNVDLKSRVITGGLKTDAGKNRAIPIHDKTFNFWERWVSRASNGRIFVTEKGRTIQQEEFRKKCFIQCKRGLDYPGERHMPPVIPALLY